MVPQTRLGDWPFGLFAPPLLPAADTDAPATDSSAGAGVLKPFVERVPDVESRLRRFTEKVSLIINSLLANGSITQSAPGVFVIDASAISGSASGLSADGRTPGHYGD